MIAIFKREFRAFFQSVMGYLFIAANLFLIGIYFFAYNLNGAYPYFSYTLSGSVYIFLVTIPILTMRIISEDRKNKTDQLILTSPVSVTKIVLGKFFAVAAVFLIMLALVCCYPLIMGMFGSVPYKETYVAILGFGLYGLAGISIGVFISSITESQIIAVVLSFVAMFVTYLMGALCSLISSSGNLITKILGCFDLATRFDTFLQGTLELTGVVYFVSVIVLMLFFTTQSIQKRRYSVSVKSLKMGAYSTGAIVIFTAVIVFANMIVAKLPEKYTIFDMTDNKLYSLTNDSKNMLKSVDEDVNILIYCTKDNFDETVNELLRRYEGESSNVHVQYIDPVANPQFYKKYSSSVLSTGTVIVESGEKYRVISYDDLFVYDYSLNSYTYSYDTTLVGIDAEGQITSAIAFVTNDESHVIYYSSGHGEETLEASFSDIISKANVSFEEIKLLTEDNVPDDCECLLINCPTGDFNEDDIAKLRTYAQNGGRLIISLATTEESEPNLYDFIAEYGLIVDNRLVADTNRGYYLQTPFYLLPTVEYTTITSSVYNDYYIFAPYSLAMTKADDVSDDVYIYELLTTSDNSFAKDMSQEISSYNKEEGDTDGPFVLAAKSEKTYGKNTSSLVVTSCAYLFTEAADSMVSGGNLKLFSSIITDAVNLENNISIPYKTFDAEYLTLTTANIVLWRNITMFLVPFGLLIWGIVVWLRRRKK